MRPDHAFIEYEDEKSVAYALAVMDGVALHGKKLDIQPKITTEVSIHNIHSQ